MLPSGNDAAIALAEFFGSILIEKSQEQTKSGPTKRNMFIARNSQFTGWLEILAFLEEMTRLASSLGLKATFFDTPHGLNNWASRSTAFDLAKLCCICMKNTKFK